MVAEIRIRMAELFFLFLLPYPRDLLFFFFPKAPSPPTASS
ncbi:hypothetical protein SLEP1_g40877 [Rubroshorea leprosula]|uniref:Uncharacterized protein n=1 Tax=Rubroshorea leprosula TaxID=152421 RepID=A0AAV5L4S6_9ROSI|nr:hypothetical protein SLEP1_g40877 [Rubroshorea leprosula]